MSREEAEKSKAAFLKRLDEEPPLDKAGYDNLIKSLHGTRTQIATMYEGGEISVNRSGYSIEGVRFQGSSTYLPTEPDYEKAKSEFKVYKVGDSNRIQERFVNDTWIVESEESVNIGD